MSHYGLQELSWSTPDTFLAIQLVQGSDCFLEASLILFWTCNWYWAVYFHICFSDALHSHRNIPLGDGHGRSLSFPCCGFSSQPSQCLACYHFLSSTQLFDWSYLWFPYVTLPLSPFVILFKELLNRWIEAFCKQLLLGSKNCMAVEITGQGQG